MKLWCSHRWSIVSVTHTDPSTIRTERVQGYELTLEYLRVVEKLAKGLTHVVQRCELCGALRDYEMAGIHDLEGAATPGRHKTNIPQSN
jgi:hypothetical protein